MCRLHHQDERWQLQSHDLRRLWLRVLLAVHEGNIRPALPEVSSCTEAAKPKCLFIFWQLFFIWFPSVQSIRLYFLGKETMEQEEEDSLATWHTCWRPCWHCPHCWYSHTRHDYWHPRVRRKKGEVFGHILAPVLWRSGDMTKKSRCWQNWAGNTVTAFIFFYSFLLLLLLVIVA